MPNLDEFYMREALKEAKKAALLGEVPVGAVLVYKNKIIAREHNTVERDKDATMHAELKAIRKASKNLARWRLTGTTLYTSLEPCSMCAGAIVNSRVDRLVIAAKDKKRGCCGSLINLVDDSAFNHRVETLQGILQEESEELLKNFFKSRRKENKLKKVEINNE